jgi:hypothetical protein
VGPAMLAKAAGTVESLFALLPPVQAANGSLSRRTYPTTDATVLLRSLYEGVLVFMWISIDPKSHMERWLKKCAIESLRFDADWRKRDMPLLDDRNLEFCNKMKAATRLREAPDRAQMAKEVDDKWQGHFPGLPPTSDHDFGLTLMGLYQHVYRLGSAAAHNDLREMRPFFTADPLGDTFIHTERAGEYYLYPWLFAPWVFGLGLCVLSDQFRWPDCRRVREALQGVYILGDQPREM